MVTTPPEELELEPDEFVIQVDFDRNAAHPERVFRAIDGIITALEGLDRTLVDSIFPEIETVLVLADVQAGSIRVRLRNVLRTVNEDALAKTDWKLVLGHYLRAGRNAFIDWVDEGERLGVKQGFGDLRTRFFELARSTEVKKMGDYGPPSARGVVDSAVGLSKAVKQLAPRDRATYRSGGSVVDLRPGIDWTPDLIADLTIRETIHLPPAQMILIVKRPDYLSNTQWIFRHGRKTIPARIDDEGWVKRFFAREIVIRPGDALRCLVASSVAYGVDNEPATETHRIIEVLGIVEDEARRKTEDLMDPQRDPDGPADEDN